MSQNGSQRGVEWLCVRECLRFSRRHHRYLLIFLMLYWHSLWHWKHARAARYGFCFLQLYDDIMDGDRVTTATPDVVAAQTIAEWDSGQYRGDSSLSRLGAALDASFRNLPLLPEDDPRHDVMMLLQAMHRDAQRVATRVLLTRTELKTQLRTTFHHSVNLLLIASRMPTRAARVPDLVEALGWCSVVRDLNEDLGKGLINVPAEVVQRVEASGGKLTAPHPEIQHWLEEERLAALSYLQHSAVTLQTLTTQDPRAARLLGLFHRSIKRYANEKARPCPTTDQHCGVNFHAMNQCKRRPFLAWPGWPHLRLAGWLTLLVAVWFGLVYVGADGFTAQRTLRVRVHLEAELRLPLTASFTLIYLSPYALFAAAPFVLRTRREIIPLAWAQILAIAIAGIGFLLLPAQLAFAPPTDSELAGWKPLFECADKLNLDYNLVPSLHVALSFVCIEFFAAHATTIVRILLRSWGWLIAASTLLTHQHHLLDVATGWLLAMVVVKLVRRIEKFCPTSNLSTHPISYSA